jgi:hypothetical protein
MAVNAMAAKAEAVAAASSCFMILPYSRSGLEDGGAGKKATILSGSPGVWNEPKGTTPIRRSLPTAYAS